MGLTLELLLFRLLLQFDRNHCTKARKNKNVSFEFLHQKFVSKMTGIVFKKKNLKISQ